MKQSIIPTYVRSAINAWFDKNIEGSFDIAYQVSQANLRIAIKSFIASNPNYRYTISASTFELNFVTTSDEIKTQHVIIEIDTNWTTFVVLLKEESTNVYKEIYNYNNE